MMQDCYLPKVYNESDPGMRNSFYVMLAATAFLYLIIFTRYQYNFFCILWIQQWVLKIILGWFSFQRGDPSHILMGEVQSLRRRFPRIHSSDCCRGLPCFNLCPTTSIHHSFWSMVNILCKKFHIFAILSLHLLIDNMIKSLFHVLFRFGLSWPFYLDGFLP